MKHDTSSRASALLRKASPAFEPSSSDRTRTRAAIRRRIAVGIAASAAASATTKTAAAAPSIAPAAIAGASGTAAAGGASLGAAATTGAGIGFATKIVAAVAILGSVSAGAVGVHRASQARANANANANANAKTSTSTSTQTEARAAMPISKPPTIDVTPAQETTAATPIADVEGPVANVEALPSPAPRHSTSSTSTATATAAPTLQIGAEVDLVRRAQEALHDGNANAALALLDEHARKYPNGALAEEREAARIVALCDASRVDDARTSANAFTNAHPASPFAARIAASCAGSSER